jgi:hypothetical protein
MNREEGVVHIPIEDAMRLMVERGTLSPSAGAGGQREMPGLMPSDASAGRVVERRRQ